MSARERRPFNLAHVAVLLNCCLLVVASLASPDPQRKASSKAVAQQPTNAKDLLSLGNFYYNSNDTSEIAATQYKSLIARYPNTKEAEAAQFYLASYYHRKYYIRKERWRTDYKDSLRRAESEYKTYLGRYSNARSPEWLSDAGFNLSLAYMEEGDFSLANNQLDRIVLFYSRSDPSVYIHQVIWSADPNDMIDQSFNGKELAEHTRPVAMVQQSIDAVVRSIKEWCRAGKKQ